jgi:hypothetical protein
MDLKEVSCEGGRPMDHVTGGLWYQQRWTFGFHCRRVMQAIFFLVVLTLWLPLNWIIIINVSITIITIIWLLSLVFIFCLSLMELPISTLCCVCNWRCSCWLGTLIINNWIIIIIIIRNSMINFSTFQIPLFLTVFSSPSPRTHLRMFIGFSVLYSILYTCPSWERESSRCLINKRLGGAHS